MTSFNLSLDLEMIKFFIGFLATAIVIVFAIFVLRDMVQRKRNDFEKAECPICRNVDEKYKMNFVSGKYYCKKHI